jgi:hypothetical protein
LDAQYTRSNVAAYDGSWSIRYDGVAYENFTTDYSVGLPVSRNTDYILTYYYKGTITSGSGPTTLIASGNPYGGTITTIYNPAQGSFTKATVNFNSGANDYVWIRIFGNGGTVTYYFDMFDLELSVLTYNSPLPAFRQP